jgi:hypothetical protein
MTGKDGEQIAYLFVARQRVWKREVVGCAIDSGAKPIDPAVG